MIKEVTIKNYKSVYSTFLELGKVNVLVGGNGTGKSNLLEAIATLSAEKDGVICVEDLIGKGVRVAKPDLTIGSYYGRQAPKVIEASLRGDIEGKLYNKIYKLVCDNWENAYSDWINEYRNHPLMNLEHFIRNSAVLGGVLKNFQPGLIPNGMANFDESVGKFKSLERTFDTEKNQSATNYIEIAGEHLASFLIFSPTASALRGFTHESKKTPLGLHGEGLDLLIASFTDEERFTLLEYASRYVNWLEDIIIEENDQFMSDEYRMSRSNSVLFFKDRRMLRKNRLLSVENVDDGTLKILFYLALFLSDKTPSFLALDNIDSGLNPLICQSLIRDLIALAKKAKKQVLITTNSPTLIDSLDIENIDICLFALSRTQEGQTEIKKIHATRKELQFDPLSAKWLRGDF